MLWPPWEAVPECSPQIQAWDYLGGYYIRCRGNFRDSKLKNHLASAGPDYLLATAYVEFIYTLRRQFVQAPPVLSSQKINGLHRFQCSHEAYAAYVILRKGLQP
jgi:hypothetical protein